MARNPQSQWLHNSMVEVQANHWKSKGYRVSADLPGWAQPALIRGFIPDVAAEGGLLGIDRVITEVETAESLNTDHTRRQWLTFSSLRGIRFEVVVPESALAQAQALARGWRVRVDRWWYRRGV